MGNISYADKLKTKLYWWLGSKRAFIINNEYKIELMFIDRVNNSAKIQITNLKNGTIIDSGDSSMQEVGNDS